MNIGDRIEMPAYVSPSGRHRPWRGPNPAPAGAPREQGVVIGLNPCEVRFDNGLSGPALESEITVIGAVGTPAAAPVPITGTQVWATKYATAPTAPAPAYYPPTKKATPIYDSNVQHPAGGGVCCKRCHDINLYAEPNQPDGSFVCRACRQDPYRFSV